MVDGREIADAKADELARLSWAELDATGERIEEVAAGSGRTFRVRSSAGWDLEEWASGMNILVKVYAPSGVRRYRPYKAWRTRGGPDDPVPEQPRD